MIAIRLEPQIEKRLERLAKETGRTKTYYVREAILEHLGEIESAHAAQRRSARPGRTYSAKAVKKTLSVREKPSKKNAAVQSPVLLPDFMARLKADFGGRITPDSKPIFDELRADRF